MGKDRDGNGRHTPALAIVRVDPVAVENLVAAPTQQTRGWYTLRLSPGLGGKVV